MFKICFPLFIFIFITSCSTQKRLQEAAQKAATVKQSIHQSTATLNSLRQTTAEQLSSAQKDSTISNRIDEVISKLQKDLSKIEETVNAVELAAQKKSNFNEHRYYYSTKSYVDRLDSFQAAGKMRDRIYQLLNNAVSINAFRQFDMGTFFEPGAYKMPPTAFVRISEAFQPAIDSLIKLSNNYSDIKHTAYFVLVGYADGVPISSSSSLYSELKPFIRNVDTPDKGQLNLMLSNLRAQELLRNMKIIMLQNAQKLSNAPRLKLAYTSYGRGESLPFKNITDYKIDDERRRVVVFYWSVLPAVNE